MTDPPHRPSLLDRQEAAIARRFEQAVLDRVRRLLTPELIAEHRANPVGAHSAELDFVLGVVRRHASPEMDRLLIFATKDGEAERERLRVLEHPTRTPAEPMAVREPAYETVEEITHRIFLDRLLSLGLELPAGADR